LIVSLDDERRWYRYHHLYRAFLAARLDRESPRAVADLHRRASAWYERNPMLVPAVEHALMAGDLAHAAVLIETSASALIARGEYATLHCWLEQMPECILAVRPALYLWVAWAALLAAMSRRSSRRFGAPNAPGGQRTITGGLARSRISRPIWRGCDTTRHRRSLRHSRR
jgi:ATP/maltotriose-dependent transcriptional regulator MalT